MPPDYFSGMGLGYTFGLLMWAGVEGHKLPPLVWIPAFCFYALYFVFRRKEVKG